MENKTYIPEELWEAETMHNKKFMYIMDRIIGFKHRSILAARMRTIIMNKTAYDICYYDSMIKKTDICLS